MYLIIKSLHIISVITWMAGLLYLPRIFVYHAETKSDDVKTTFKVMERRLFVYIMNPAMILSWLFGLILIHSIGIQSFSEFWLIAKIVLAILLFCVIVSCGKKADPEYKAKNNDTTSINI